MRKGHPVSCLLRGSLALLAGFSLVGILGVRASLAQEDTDVVEERDGIEIEEPGRRIEEIIVTAERRESSVRDTSIAISAFTGEFLDDFGIRNQEDLQNFIPATTIQPYDATIRGIGRNFRALGGDPGVATYMNGIYSEDLLTATAATFWDVQRIEVLRGPQGTLYGRNAVGGAINILYREPTDEAEAAFRSIYGNFGTQEYYGVVSGPLGSDKLSGRVNFSLRERDGVIDDIGWGSDLDGLGTKNIALQLKFEPTDDITLNIRQNFMRIDRSFGGANGGGLVVLNENGEGSRVTDALVPGYRAIATDAMGNPTNVANLTTDPNYFENDARVPGDIFQFTNPTTGTPVWAQRIRPGIDPYDGNGAQNAAASLDGFNSTLPGTEALYNGCVFPGDITGDALCAATNGLNREQFDQDGTQLNFTWNLTDDIELHYLFGYNELTYQRTTDDDNTASRFHDRQFYVNHEAQYSSHEVQAFVDVNDAISFTSGIFFYDATIDQRGDFYSSLGEARMADPYMDKTEFADQAQADAFGAHFGVPAGTFTPGPGTSFYNMYYGAILQSTAPIDLYSAKDSCVGSAAPSCQRNFSVENPQTGGNRFAGLNFQQAPWYGDNGSNAGGILLDALHGPNTIGTDLLYATQTQRDAFAVYTQGVWDFSERFSLTAGVRYARDTIAAEENVWRYSETFGPDGAGGTVLPEWGSLAEVNATNDGLVADGLGELTDATPKVTNGGIPYQFSIYRPMERTDDKVTFRVNLDWDINESAMMYFSATSGYRSGGYTLVFFSQQPTYDPEELIAYEIGYKTLFFDETLQVNGSFFYYDYDNIHTTAVQVNSLGGNSTGTVTAPGGRVIGVEAELLWLATDYLTLGSNFSYTPSEYTADLELKDSANVETPASLFPFYEAQNINGNQLLQVPEWKFTGWGSYRIPLSGGSDLEFFGVYSWTDEVYYSPFQSEAEKADPYGRLDMRATWRSNSQMWGISVFANNLLNDIGVLQVLREGEDEFFRHSGGTTVPRHFGVELTVALGGYGF